MHLIIDGLDYDVKVQLSREADVRASDISGPMLNGVEFNDILGTYYNYTVTFRFPLYDQSAYAALYEVLTAPVAAHSFLMPYSDTTILLTAKVEPVYDEIVEMDNGRTYWRACRFNLVSIAPTKEETLGEVIARGLPVLPDVFSPEDGDAYEWDGTGWVALEDADSMAF